MATDAKYHKWWSTTCVFLDTTIRSVLSSPIVHRVPKLLRQSLQLYARGDRGPKLNLKKPNLSAERLLLPVLVSEFLFIYFALDLIQKISLLTDLMG